MQKESQLDCVKMMKLGVRRPLIFDSAGRRWLSFGNKLCIRIYLRERFQAVPSRPTQGQTSLGQTGKFQESNNRHTYCLWPCSLARTSTGCWVYGLGAPKGSTGSSSDFKGSQDSGPLHKVSYDRLGKDRVGEARNRTIGNNICLWPCSLAITKTGRLGLCFFMSRNTKRLSRQWFLF